MSDVFDLSLSLRRSDASSRPKKSHPAGTETHLLLVIDNGRGLDSPNQRCQSTNHDAGHQKTTAGSLLMYSCDLFSVCVLVCVCLVTVVFLFVLI